MTMTSTRSILLAACVAIGLGWLAATHSAATDAPLVGSAPFSRWVAVTPSDNTTYGIPGADNPIPIDSLYVGIAGNVAVIDENRGTAVTFSNVPTGSTLNLRPYKIMSTGTTASGIVRLHR